MKTMTAHSNTTHVNDFGCLPIRVDVQAGNISVSTRSDYAESMALIERSGRLHEGWMYQPLPTKVGNRKVGHRYEPFPYPQPRFVLPITHELRHEVSTSVEQLHFLIGAIGFLLGFRLLPNGHGYLHRTPMRSGLATDLTGVDGCELALCLPHIDATWAALAAEQRQALRAMIVAYQTALSYRYAYEQFTFLYNALDAAWRYHWIVSGQGRKPTHTERPVWLCTDVLSIPVPDWAQLPPKGPSSVADRRNRLIHEAIFEDEPLGYASRQGPLLDIKALVSRAIVKALGIPCRYVSSPATTQQMHGLDLIR